MMPVIIKVKRVLDARDMNISQFSEIANISYPTALAWYHGTARRVELETLANVCAGLGIQVSDVLEYVPENKETTKS